jgi:hypothetical protein
MRTICAIVLPALFFLGQSCKKNASSPNRGQSDSLELSITYLDTSRVPPANFELIVQEPTGKVLLDTLAPVNAEVKAKLHTSDSLVNLTTVYMGTHDTAFSVTSYLGVNPAGWQVFPVNNAFVVLPLIPNAAVHQTFVENIPGLAAVPLPQSLNYVWFSDLDISAFFPSEAVGSTSISLNGSFHGNNYLYSLIPSLGLYNFHVQNWSGGTDMVDLSQMDTAQQVNFQRPVQYGKCYCILDGIMDTTDLSKSVMLYFSSFIASSFDLEYPTKLVQKYQLHATFLAPDSTQVTYYSYGNVISPGFLFPDPSRYSITSVQSSNFSMNFNGLTPAFYETQWKTQHVNFYIYSAPDSNVQHPQTLLTSLNSQKLQGLGNTALTPVNMSFETVDGMNYAAFLSYSASPSVFANRRVASAVRLVKQF